MQLLSAPLGHCEGASGSLPVLIVRTEIYILHIYHLDESMFISFSTFQVIFFFFIRHLFCLFHFESIMECSLNCFIEIIHQARNVTHSNVWFFKQSFQLWIIKSIISNLTKSQKWTERTKKRLCSKDIHAFPMFLWYGRSSLDCPFYYTRMSTSFVSFLLWPFGCLLRSGPSNRRRRYCSQRTIGQWWFRCLADGSTQRTGRSKLPNTQIHAHIKWKKLWYCNIIIVKHSRTRVPGAY